MDVPLKIAAMAYDSLGFMRHPSSVAKLVAQVVNLWRSLIAVSAALNGQSIDIL
jgi:hypothetical protein